MRGARQNRGENRYSNKYNQPFQFKRNKGGYDELTMKDSNKAYESRNQNFDSINMSNMSFNSPHKASDYGNEELEILKHFEIIESLDFVRKSSKFNSINLVGPKTGFLTQQNNIYSFNWQGKVPPVELHDYPQERFDVIYNVKEIFSQLLIVGKKGNEIQFVVKSISGPSRILFSSIYDPFDAKNYKNSVIISKDKTNIFIR